MGRGVLMLGVWVLLLVGAPDPKPALWWAAFVFFVLTAATDVVDGAIARKYGDVTVFGRIADPLVDKLLILGTMVMILPLDGASLVLPGWAVVIMLSREVVVTALRGAVEGVGVSFHAMPIGKAKMLSQSIAVGSVLLWGAGLGFLQVPLPVLGDLLGDHWNLPHLLVWLATLLTAVSGLDYGVRAARLLSRG
jgi:CDP-diacylglycerol--glycerol-3-phosphate 3-phosphatidyltransferase